MKDKNSVPNNASQFVLERNFAVKPNQVISKNKRKIFDISKPEDIKALEDFQHNKFEYAFEEPNHKRVKLYIAPVAALNGELGVFAGEDIKANAKIPLGNYVGRKSALTKENLNSKYKFQLTNKNGVVKKIIDAEKYRSWPAFVNHSQVPSLVAKEYENKQGQKQIGYFAASQILKDQQLLVDYGNDFFIGTKLEFKPVFMHAEDNHLLPDEIYSHNDIYPHYAKGIYSFDKKTYADLHLSTNNWVIPKFFKLIYKNNLDKIAELFSRDCPVDLFAYACDKDKILPSSEQQHLTGLMLSCYLGNEACIELLLAYEADIDRCMLMAGYSPLILLLIGYAEFATKEKIGLKLLNEMCNPLSYDFQLLNVLHYAISINSLSLVEKILEISVENNNDTLEFVLYSDENSPVFNSFDHCLLNDKFEILNLLITNVLQNKMFLHGKFIECINEGIIFKDDTFKKIDLKKLVKFKCLIEFDKFQNAFDNTRLKSIIEYHIEFKLAQIDTINCQAENTKLKAELKISQQLLLALQDSKQKQAAQQEETNLTALLEMSLLKKAKQEIDEKLSILDDQLSDMSDDCYKRGNEEFQKFNFPKAAYYYKKSFICSERTSQPNYHAFFNLAATCTNLGKFEASNKMLNRLSQLKDIAQKEIYPNLSELKEVNDAALSKR